jgi:hypothetical protein
MTDARNETALMIVGDGTTLRNKTSMMSVIQNAEAGAADFVPHVTVAFSVRPVGL